MNRILLTFILFSFILAPTVLATSGACSWHGGVNCSAGADWDGSVICNDGWRGSSVSYNSMVMCRGYSYPSYDSTPSCPSHSTYSYLYETCKCNSGYIANSTGDGCISMDEYCEDLFGWHSRYNSLYDKCECDYGYVFGKGIFGDIQCIDGDDFCEDLYGWHSSYDNFSKECECDYGYIFDGDECVDEDYNSGYSGIDYDALLRYYKLLQISTCPDNSFKDTDGKCYCNIGYKVNSDKTGCIKIICSANAKLVGNECVCDDGYVKNGSLCISHTQDCQNKYGKNVYGEKGNNNNSICYCAEGYEWNNSQTACIKEQPCQDMINGYLGSDGKCYCKEGYIWDNVNSKCIENVIVKGHESEEFKNLISDDNENNIIEQEKELFTGNDVNLSNRLKGKILLQVEEGGEGWYVNPEDSKKYYLGRPADAFNIMRKLGLGIAEKSYESFSSYAPLNLSGKILLRVEANGEAYYINSSDRKIHYLGRPADAFNVMRNLGLGINNSDIRKIEVGEVD